MTLEERFALFYNSYVAAYGGTGSALLKNEWTPILHGNNQYREKRMTTRFGEDRLAIHWFDWRSWMLQ